MPECKFCKEIELEWFFQENTSKYKLGRKMDDNNYIPHECKKFKPKNTFVKKEKSNPYRYVSTMVMDFCKKHKIELTELKRCSECGLDKQCYYATVENKLLKYPYRFTIKDGKEIKDYDITIHDVIKNNLSN
jgi:hypothetical protein